VLVGAGARRFHVGAGAKRVVVIFITHAAVHVYRMGDAADFAFMQHVEVLGAVGGGGFFF